MNGQITFSELHNPRFYIDRPIRLIELFAGIGSQAKALKRLGVDFEHWVVVEFDKYAIKSYNAIHGTNFNTSDIRNITAADLRIVDIEKFIYAMTYSFPCQDLSSAGKGAGMKKGDNTRSGLLWEVERLLIGCGKNLPQILLMENVPEVHGTKNLKDFTKWVMFLEKLGYSNFLQDLNAKDYGIPQNRDRAFMVSILGKWDYKFSQPQPLKLRLKDMLEQNVDEKYYLSDAQIALIQNSNFNTQKTRIQNGGDLQDTMCKGLQRPNVCKTIRSGGRGSLDQHCWDLVVEE